MSLIQNLIPDPRFKTGRWYTLNSTVTPIPEHGAVNVANTGDKWDSFMQVILPDVSQYRGVSMTFACSLAAIDGSAKEGGNGLLWIWVNSKTAKASDGGDSDGRAEKRAIHTAERRHRTHIAMVCAE